MPDKEILGSKKCQKHFHFEGSLVENRIRCFIIPVSRHCSVHAIKFAATAVYIYWHFILRSTYTNIYRWKRIIVCGTQTHSRIDKSKILSAGSGVGEAKIETTTTATNFTQIFFFNHPCCLFSEKRIGWKAEISLRA